MASGYSYDPSTGKWVYKSSNTNSNTSSKTDSNNKGGNTTSPTTGGTDSKKNDSNKNNNSSKSDVTNKKQQEANEKSINVLNATINVIISPESLILKSGDTLTIDGVGSYLSGDYLITDVKITLDGSSGLSQEISCSKFNVEKSLKPNKYEKEKDGVKTEVDNTAIDSGKIIVTGNRVNIRKGAGITYSIIATVTKDSTYTRISENDTDKWYCINYKDEKAFISKSYSRISQ